MSQTLQRIRELVARREVRVSEHGYDELADEDIFLDEILAGIAEAAVVEDYPTYHKGPCVLVLQPDDRGGRSMSSGESPRILRRQRLW